MVGHTGNARQELPLPVHEMSQVERDLAEAHRIARLGTWRWVRPTDTVVWSAEVYRTFDVDPALPPPGYVALQAMHAPASRAKLQEAVQRALTLGEPYEMDVEIITQAGVRKWIIARGEPAAWVEGEVSQLRGTIQDITERKQIETALQEREAELREAHRIARVGSWRWTRAGDTLTWSREIYEIFGRDPALHPPRREEAQQYYTEESRQRHVIAVEKAIAEGKPYELDLAFLHPDGLIRWVTVRGVIESIVDGQVMSVRGTLQDITERKRAEEKVLQGERQYLSVLNSITDGFLVLDNDWRCTYFSEQGARILNMRVEDLLGGCVWDVFPHTSETRFGAAYREAVATGKPVHFDEYYPEPLNKWLECHCYPSADGLSVYFRDITDQRLAEEAVRESQARFQKLYEVNLLGVCYPDKFGAFSDGNEEFLRIVGYSRQDLEAGLVRWDKMTPKRYAALDAEHIAEAMERGSCTPYQKEYIRKDGASVPILCGYALLPDSTDQFIGFIMDLTAQKQAEDAVHEREQRFSTLADSLPQLIWMSDPDGTKRYANQQFLSYTGLMAEQMRVFAWQDLVHPEDVGEMMQLRADCMRSGESFVSEFRIRRADGMYRSFLARARPMRNEAGEIERWIGSATDVHDQKLAEQALRQTEKLAATGRMAASIAHEINNPLEAVTNSLYLALQDPSLSATTRSYLKMGEQELARVAQMTTQTLRFHRQSVAAVTVDLAEVMDSAFGLYAARFGASQITVDRQYGEGRLLYCRADEMRQVFANFLSNALDATRSGGHIRIRMRAGHDGAGRPGVRVTLADNGHGIPVPLQQTIFEPFISTKDTTGTGLGLWVSQGIVHKHKGRILLRSRTGAVHHGTVFALFFPTDGLDGSAG